MAYQLPVLFPTTLGLLVRLPAEGKMVSSISGSSRCTSSGLIRTIGPTQVLIKFRLCNAHGSWRRLARTIFSMHLVDGEKELATEIDIMVDLRLVRNCYESCVRILDR